MLEKPFGDLLPWLKKSLGHLCVNQVFKKNYFAVIYLRTLDLFAKEVFLFSFLGFLK